MTLKYRAVLAGLFIIPLLAAAMTAEAGAPCKFQDLAKGPGFKNSVWGLSVRYADTGREVISCNNTKNLVPASILKLFVTAAALETFGPGHKFRTRVYIDGPVSNGTLNGSLYIRGGGDPSFGSNLIKGAPSARDEFGKWSEALKAAGITGIRGSVIADDSLFKGPPLPGSWAWEDIGNYYAAQPTALAVNDNLYRLYFRPGAKPGDPTGVLRTEPKIEGLEFKNMMRTGPKGSGDNGYIFNFPGQYLATLRGTVPLGPEEFAIKGSIPDPALFLARELTAYLQLRGIKVNGPPAKYIADTSLSVTGRAGKPVRITNEKDYGALKFIAETEGAPLKDIVFATNKRSFNLYAEMLLRHLALAGNKPGSADNGLQALRDFMAASGMDVSEVKLADASGLSRLSTVQAGDFTIFLGRVSKKKYFPAYADSLVSPADPDATGHIKKMGMNTKLEKDLKIKSGSLKGVRGYAGYLKTKKGRTLVFTSIINNYSASGAEVDSLHERVLLELMEKY